jgi:hypothetical protein
VPRARNRGNGHDSMKSLMTCTSGDHRENEMGSTCGTEDESIESCGGET